MAFSAEKRFVEYEKRQALEEKNASQIAAFERMRLRTHEHDRVWLSAQARGLGERTGGGLAVTEF